MSIAGRASILTHFNLPSSIYTTPNQSQNNKEIQNRSFSAMERSISSSVSASASKRSKRKGMLLQGGEESDPFALSHFSDKKFDAENYAMKFFLNRDINEIDEDLRQLNDLGDTAQNSLREKVCLYYRMFMKATEDIKSIEEDVTTLGKKVTQLDTLGDKVDDAIERLLDLIPTYDQIDELDDSGFGGSKEVQQQAGNGEDFVIGRNIRDESLHDDRDGHIEKGEEKSLTYYYKALEEIDNIIMNATTTSMIDTTFYAYNSRKKNEELHNEVKNRQEKYQREKEGHGIDSLGFTLSASFSQHDGKWSNLQNEHAFNKAVKNIIGGNTTNENKRELQLTAANNNTFRRKYKSKILELDKIQRMNIERKRSTVLTDITKFIESHYRTLQNAAGGGTKTEGTKIKDAVSHDILVSLEKEIDHTCKQIIHDIYLMNTTFLFDACDFHGQLKTLISLGRPLAAVTYFIGHRSSVIQRDLDLIEGPHYLNFTSSNHQQDMETFSNNLKDIKTGDNMKTDEEATVDTNSAYLNSIYSSLGIPHASDEEKSNAIYDYVLRCSNYFFISLQHTCENFDILFQDVEDIQDGKVKKNDGNDIEIDEVEVKSSLKSQCYLRLIFWIHNEATKFAYFLSRELCQIRSDLMRKSYSTIRFQVLEQIKRNHIYLDEHGKKEGDRSGVFRGNAFIGKYNYNPWEEINLSLPDNFSFSFNTPRNFADLNSPNSSEDEDLTRLERDGSSSASLHRNNLNQSNLNSARPDYFLLSAILTPELYVNVGDTTVNGSVDKEKSKKIETLPLSPMNILPGDKVEGIVESKDDNDELNDTSSPLKPSSQINFVEHPMTTTQVQIKSAKMPPSPRPAPPHSPVSLATYRSATRLIPQNGGPSEISNSFTPFSSFSGLSSTSMISGISFQDPLPKNALLSDPQVENLDYDNMLEDETTIKINATNTIRKHRRRQSMLSRLGKRADLLSSTSGLPSHYANPDTTTSPLSPISQRVISSLSTDINSSSVNMSFPKLGIDIANNSFRDSYEEAISQILSPYSSFQTNATTASNRSTIRNPNQSILGNDDNHLSYITRSESIQGNKEGRRDSDSGDQPPLSQESKEIRINNVFDSSFMSLGECLSLPLKLSSFLSFQGINVRTSLLQAFAISILRPTLDGFIHISMEKLYTVVEYESFMASFNKDTNTTKFKTETGEDDINRPKSTGEAIAIPFLMISMKVKRKDISIPSLLAKLSQQKWSKRFSIQEEEKGDRSRSNTAESKDEKDKDKSGKSKGKWKGKNFNLLPNLRRKSRENGKDRERGNRSGSVVSKGGENKDDLNIKYDRGNENHEEDTVEVTLDPDDELEIHYEVYPSLSVLVNVLKSYITNYHILKENYHHQLPPSSSELAKSLQSIPKDQYSNEMSLYLDRFVVSGIFILLCLYSLLLRMSICIQLTPKASQNSRLGFSEKNAPSGTQDSTKVGMSTAEKIDLYNNTIEAFLHFTIPSLKNYITKHMTIGVLKSIIDNKFSILDSNLKGMYISNSN